MSESAAIDRVFVTGATGFVGRSVVRRLLSRGLTPVCLVRSPHKLFKQHPSVDPERFVVVTGHLRDASGLGRAAEQCQAAIHLVGIIIERRLRGQTFHGIHVRGTEAVLDAVQAAGIRRYVHMSALGARAGAASRYHRTKCAAEELVRQTELDWVIFRPSLVHGPHGEFMRLMKRLACGFVPPVMPYFGAGDAKVQPVSVKDVAHSLVEAVRRDDGGSNEIGKKEFELGGPIAYSWVELYETCRALMPGSKKWKPLVSQPPSVAKMLAALSGPPMAIAELLLPTVGMFRFDAGQVDMATEDSVCDHTIAERTFDLSMRSFAAELAAYAGLIR